MINLSKELHVLIPPTASEICLILNEVGGGIAGTCVSQNSRSQKAKRKLFKKIRSFNALLRFSNTCHG